MSEQCNHDYKPVDINSYSVRCEKCGKFVSCYSAEYVNLVNLRKV